MRQAELQVSEANRTLMWQASCIQKWVPQHPNVAGFFHPNIAGPRVGNILPKRSSRDAPIGATMHERRGCVWNSARQLGRSHWESDTVLHVEVRHATRYFEIRCYGMPAQSPGVRYGSIAY